MSLISWTRDLFDANTEEDRRKRKARGEAEWYADQQRQRGVKRVSNNPLQRLTNTGRNIRDTAGASTARVGVGLLQGGSGLYDLASPGKGTNRFSQALERNARELDALAKDQGLGTAYKVGNVVGELGTYAVPGVGAAKLSTKIPAIARTSNVVSRAASVVDAGGQANKARRVVASGMRRGLTPDQLALDAGITAKYTGENASKGRQTTPLSVGADLGLGVVGGTAAPILGDAARIAARQIAQRARPVASKAVDTAKRLKADQGGFIQVGRTPKRIHPEDAGTLSDFIDLQRGVYRPDPKTKQNLEFEASAIMERYGITPSGNKSVRPELRAVNAIERRLQEEARPSALQRLKNSQQGGAPLNADESPVAKAITQTTPVREQPKLAPTQTQPQPQSLTNLPPQTAVAPQAADITPPPPQAVGTTKQPLRKETRFASKTVPESEFVGETVSKTTKENAPLYDVETEKGRFTASTNRMKELGVDGLADDVSERLNAKQASSQDISDGITAAQALEVMGDPKSLQKAADVYDKLSEQLTRAGQTVQAAAILARRTPQGLNFYAQRQLKKMGVEVTPKLQTELKGLIEAVQKAKPGTEAEALARDNVMYFIAKQAPTSTADKVVNFWRSGLLTAPTTSGGALVGNTGEMLTRKLWTNPVAALSDWTMSFFFTGKRTQTLAKTGQFGKGFGKGRKNVTTKQYWKSGYDPMNQNATAQKYDLTSRRVNYGDGAIGKPVGAYVNGVYSLMGAFDQPFRYGAYNESLSSLAKAEAINRGLKGRARADFVDNFIDNPPTAAKERATKEAMYATFQDDTALGKVAQGAKQSLKNSGHHKAAAFVDFLMPFTGVPSSIATRMVRRTPIGTASEIAKQILNVRKGGQFDQRAMAQAIGDGSAGVPIIAAGYTLAQSGLLTGGYPSDQKTRKQWENEGKQPNSVKIGDRWYSLNYIQPFGVIMSLGAGIQDAESKGATPLDAAFQGAASGAQSFTSQSFVQGIAGALDALNSPETVGERFVANTAGSVVPNFLRSAARASDPLQRQQDGILDGVKGSIPGVRQTLDPKLDQFGQPLAAKDNFLNQYVNPLKPSIAKDSDPVVKEMSRLLSVDEGVLPSKARKNTFKDTELTSKQMRELDTATGPKVKTAFEQIMKNPGYSSLSDEDKAKALKNASQDIFAVEKAVFAEKNGLEGPELSGRQKLIASGGGGTDSYIRSALGEPETYQEKYDTLLAQYNDPKSGWSEVERAKKGKELRKLEVQKDYEKDVVDLYGMSKADMYDFITNAKNGDELAKKLIAYDNALYDSGLSSYRKFKHGLAPSDKGGRGKSGLTKAELNKYLSATKSGAYLKPPEAPQVQVQQARRPQIAKVQRRRSTTKSAPKVTVRKGTRLA